MTSGLILSIGAAALMAAGFVIYLSQAARGLTRPNGAGWLMWAGGAALITLSEADLGLPRTVLAPLAIAAVGAMAVLWRSARLLPGRDYPVLLFNGAVALWTVLLLAGPVGDLGFDESTGLLFVVLSATGAVSAAWPALSAACLGEGRDRPHAWFIWSAAYGLLALSVMAEGIAWHYLIYPLVTQAAYLMIGLFTIGSGARGLVNREIESLQVR